MNSTTLAEILYQLAVTFTFPPFLKFPPHKKHSSGFCSKHSNKSTGIKKHSLKLTASSPLKIGLFAPKGKACIPTIQAFRGEKPFVSGFGAQTSRDLWFFPHHVGLPETSQRFQTEERWIKALLACTNSETKLSLGVVTPKIPNINVLRNVLGQRGSPKRRKNPCEFMVSLLHHVIVDAFQIDTLGLFMKSE